MQLLQHFKSLTLHPKNAQELKGLILQLAIQGKLTANWRNNIPDLETASDLLKNIEKNKALLIKEKLIKKEKPLAKIAKEEIPFKISEKWIWSRLDDLGTTNIGLTYKPTQINEIGTPVLRSSNVQKGELCLKDLVRVNAQYKDKDIIKEGDLLICVRNGSRRLVGKCTIIGQINEVMVFGAFMAIFRSKCNPYLQLFIQSPQFRSKLDGVETTTINQITQGNLKSTLVPLPPIEEQKEIVRVVEVLFKEVEQLEQLTKERISLKEDFVSSALRQLTTQNTQTEWAYLQNYFKDFFTEKSSIKKLRETVLQLAVQGKLTADWRACHPELVEGQHHASELLKRIQKEKAQLIKDKKIKKESPLPAISKEEIPYELPEGWVWCRIKELGVSFQNGISKRAGEGLPTVVLRLADITNKSIDLSDTRLISMTQIEKDRYNLIDGDILITRVNGSADIVGNFNPVPKLENISYCDHFIRLRFHVENITSNDYISIIANSSLIRRRIKDMFISTAGQKTVNQVHISSLLFSLPPLEEQKAIVEKVTALMGLCDRLEQEVQHNQELNGQLMKSVLREVFEGEKV